MTVSVKAPTSTTGSIQLNGSDVLTIESDNSVDIDSGTLHVDATNNNVGIGTTAPSTGYGGTISNVKLALKGSGAGGNNGTATLLMGGDNNHYSYLSSEHTGGGSTYLAFGTANGAANPTERMRIDSSGNVLVNTASSSLSSKGLKINNDGATGNFIYFGVTGTGSYNNIAFFRGTDGSLSEVGKISTTGSATSYVTSSDYRLKENVAPMSGSIDRLKQLKPSTWSWVQDGSHGEGFLAHEAQTVVPEAITGNKDAMRTEEYEVTPAVLDDDDNVVTEAVMGTREVPDYQGIDQSKLVPLLTAALQEAITKIEDLETRIQTLESA
jgi:hypothetical protein